MAYQLDSDASSISSSLDSPTEQTALLSKFPPPIVPTPPSHTVRASPHDLEAGPEPDSNAITSPSPEFPSHDTLATPYATRRSVHWDTGNEPPSTSTTSPRRERDSMSPTATRLRSLTRRQAFAEADALWDELQEEPSPAPVSGGPASSDDQRPPSPFRMRTRSRSLAWQEGHPGRGTPSPDLESPRGGRNSPTGSPGPLMRSNTGRSYRDRRPRGSQARGYGSLTRTGNWPESIGEGDGGINQGVGRRMSRMWRTALEAVAETVGESGRRRSSKGKGRGTGLGISGDGVGDEDGGGPASGA
jgi:hypothetical protein